MGVEGDEVTLILQYRVCMEWEIIDHHRCFIIDVDSNFAGGRPGLIIWVSIISVIYSNCMFHFLKTSFKRTG